MPLSMRECAKKIIEYGGETFDSLVRITGLDPQRINSDKEHVKNLYLKLIKEHPELKRECPSVFRGLVAFKKRLAGDLLEHLRDQYYILYNVNPAEARPTGDLAEAPTMAEILMVAVYNLYPETAHVIMYEFFEKVMQEALAGDKDAVKCIQAMFTPLTSKYELDTAIDAFDILYNMNPSVGKKVCEALRESRQTILSALTTLHDRIVKTGLKPSGFVLPIRRTSIFASCLGG